MAVARGTRLERELVSAPVRKPRPVKGENAAEKARTPSLDAARRTVDAVIAGKVDTRRAATALASLKLTETEKRDVESYSRERSRQTQAQVKDRMVRDTETVASFALGPDLAKGVIPGGGKPGKGGLGLDVALLAPGTVIGGPLRALRGGARALRGPGNAAHVRTFRQGATVPARSLQLGEKVQQLPAARSRVTRTLIERPADAVSRAMMGEGKLAGAARRVLPTASAEARVAKAAGREQVLEAARAQAGMARHIRKLPKEGSAEDIAHSWWAQLPVSHRNAEGLKLVRGKQAEELEEITSGRALASLKARDGALKAQMRGADEATTFELLKQRENLKLLMSDLPARVEDLSVSLARLDQVIAKPPKLKPDVVDAVQALSGDRKRILEAAQVLKPDRAADREGLVSRWLGLEPTGEEAFLGHRLGKVRSSQSSLTPVSVGAGRVKLPQGVARENKLVLAKTGRLRESTRVAVEDWQAAQVYRAATTSRQDLARMGKPFTGRLPEGHVLVNPKGRAVPPHWKTDKLAKIGQEGFDEDQIAEASREIVSTFIADSSRLDEMLAAAKAAGVKWEELRVVPEKTAARYFGQFTPAKGSSAAGKAYDVAVDFTAASIVFARLGYIPKNVAQNLILAVPHQGPRLLVNAPRAGQVLADPELRALFQAEVGFSGPTQGLAREARFGGKLRGLPAKTAAVVGKVGDDPIRITALIHEFANAGVIGKLKPVLDDADRAQLLRAFTDKQYRPLLNDVRSRAVEAMADFSRLTPTQRRQARRFLIIPGWLWAGSRYPVHFAATHPGRSAAIGAGVYLGRDEIGDRQAEGLPRYLEGIEAGGDKVMRTTSLSPVNTPWEIAMALGQQSPNTAAGYANPLAKSVYNVANRSVDGPDGPYRTSFRDSLQRNAERLAPNIDLARDLVSPDGGGRYPEDATRLGRLKRELGVVPIEIERDKTPAQRATSRTLENRELMLTEARRLKLGPDVVGPDGRLAQPVRDAWNTRAAYKTATRRLEEKKGDKLSELERFQAAAKLMVQRGLWTSSQASAEVRATAREDEGEIRRRKDFLLRDELGGYILAFVGQEIRARGGTFELSQ